MDGRDFTVDKNGIVNKIIQWQITPSGINPVFLLRRKIIFRAFEQKKRSTDIRLQMITTVILVKELK